MFQGEKKTVIEINYNDLDKAITEFLKSKGYSRKNFDKYGYECVAENEWGNYQAHTFTIGKYDWAIPDEDDRNNMLKGEHVLSTDEILEWMCAEKLIEPGEYLVEVFW